MSRAGGVLVRAVPALLALLLLAAWARWIDDPILDSPPSPERIAAGEALLHGIEPQGRSVSWAMPASTVLDALCHDHWPPAARRGVLLSLLSLSLLLVFELGRLLHSGAAGLLAAGYCLYAGLIGPRGLLGQEWGSEYALHSAAVLCVANIAVWRAQAPSVNRGVLLGLAIAMSLLVRSPLFLLPLALAGLDWAAFGAIPRGKRLLLMVPVLIIPASALLPWIHMNRQLYGRWIPFEAGRANLAMVGGALGLDSNRVLDRLELERIAPPERVPSWIARETARHPAVFAVGSARRMWRAISLQPALVLGGLLSVLMYRRRRPHLYAAFLAAYLLLVHCPLAFLDHYLSPLWPMLAALVASLFLTRSIPPPRDVSPSRVAWIAAVSLLPLCILGLPALALAAAYPHRRDASEGALQRAVEAHARDAWLLSERGRRRLGRGRNREAAADFSQAFRLRPDPLSELDYLEALLLSRGAGKPLMGKVRLDPTQHLSRRGYWLKSLAHALDSRPPAFRADFEAGRMVCVDGRPGYSTLERDIRGRFHAEDPAFSREFSAQMERISPQDRAVILRAFVVAAHRSGLLLFPRERSALADWYVTLDPPPAPREAMAVLRRTGQDGFTALGRLALAAVAVKTGDVVTARRSLSECPDAGLDAVGLRRKALLLQEVKEFSAGEALFGRLIREYPGSARYRVDRGVIRSFMGRRDDALREFEMAIRLDPQNWDAYLSAGALWLASGQPAKALACYEQGLAANAVRDDAEGFQALSRARAELLAIRR